jgi:hypothetical protein
MTKESLTKYEIKLPDNSIHTPKENDPYSNESRLYPAARKLTFWEEAAKKRIEEKQKSEKEKKAKLNETLKKIQIQFATLNKKLEKIQLEFRKKIVETIVVKTIHEEQLLHSRIKMPTRNQLDEALRSQKLQHFMHLTEITNTLDRELLTPLKLVMLVQDYCEYYNDHPDREDYCREFTLNCLSSSTIIPIILKDHPTLVEYLKKKKFI